MATNLEDLVVRLVGENAQLTRSLADSNAKIARFSQQTNRQLTLVDRSVNRLSRGFTRLGGAVVAALGARALTQATRSSAQLANQLLRTSDLLRISTDTLQLFRIEGQRLGFGATQIDTALQRVTRRFEEAAKGSGEALSTFRELGISLRNNDGTLRDTEDVLFDVADALAESDDAAGRLAQAFKLLDSEGAAQLLILRQGSRALRENLQRYRELGGVLEEDVIRRLATAGREFTLVSDVIRNRFALAVVNLTPVLDAASRAFFGFSEAVADVANQFRRLENLGTRGLEQRLAQVTDALRDARIEEGRLLFDPSLAEQALGVETQLAGVRQRIVRLTNEQFRIQDQLAKQQAEQANRIRAGGGAGGTGGGGVAGPSPSQIEAELRRRQNEDQQRSISGVLAERQRQEALRQAAQDVAQFQDEVEAASDSTAEAIESAFDSVGRTVSRIFADMAVNADVSARQILRSLASIGLQTLFQVGGSAISSALGGGGGGASVAFGGAGSGVNVPVNITNTIAGAQVQATPSTGGAPGVDVLIKSNLQSLAARDQIAPVSRTRHQSGVR